MAGSHCADLCSFVPSCHCAGPPGQIRDAEGSSHCDRCDRGFFSPITAQTQCLPCDPGTYNNVTGASFCDRCLPGTIANKGVGTGSTSCVKCQVSPRPCLP